MQNHLEENRQIILPMKCFLLVLLSQVRFQHFIGLEQFFWLFNTGISSSSVAFSVPDVGSVKSASSTYRLIPSSFITTDANTYSQWRNQASFQEASDITKGHLRASWTVLTLAWFSFWDGWSTFTGRTTAFYCLCVVVRFLFSMTTLEE